MTTPVDWLQIAQALPQGAHTRTVCSDGCGRDRTQLISHTLHGYQRKCFRCGATEFKPHGIRSIAMIERHKLERAMCHMDTLELPEDYTLDVPARYAVWYYKVGIDADLARKYRIGYTPRLERVVLPVYEDNELTAVQMRAVDPFVKPKYLNPTGPGVAHAVFTSGKSYGCTVLVEDILSAIKVGKVHHATSILGTTMTDSRAVKIADANSHVIIWTDGDKAGRKGRKEAERKLRMMGCTVSHINTPRDPKTYSLEEIGRLLRHD